MSTPESISLLWLFLCVFIVSAHSLYYKIEQSRFCKERKKLSYFILIVINIPAFVFSFFMLIAMLVGTIFYV